MTDITDLAKEIHKVYPIWINMIKADAAHPGYSIELLEKGIELAQMVINSKPCFVGTDWAKDYLDEVRQEQKEKDAGIAEYQLTLTNCDDYTGGDIAFKIAKAIQDS